MCPAATSNQSSRRTLIKSTGRVYRQNYVVFLRAAGGKIVFLREYFDPVRAAKAMNLPIAGLAS
jgi:ketosteroid isomerase-like protein